jgi:nitroimidazol reductase NimA-like FMN-containing flavoprotein (pyridoxamine 5'-phosphate oxidase superfamily)
MSPVTELDPRYGNDGVAPTSWPDTVRAIETAELFWLTTVRADGRPHVTPLVGVWAADKLHFCVGDNEQKTRNLAVNREVAMTTGSNGWESGLDIVVEGEAVQLVEPADLELAAAAWTTKWDGRWTYEIGDGCFHHPGEPMRVLVYAVAPRQVYAFGKGTFSHTRHRFT